MPFDLDIGLPGIYPVNKCVLTMHNVHCGIVHKNNKGWTQPEGPLIGD